MTQDDEQGERTVTVVRKFDTNGRLLSETTRTEVTVKPDDDPPAPAGMYL